MKTTISFFMLIASLCFACTPRSETGIRQFSSANSASNSVDQFTPILKPTAPKDNSAVVISLHANLRAEDNSRAAVLEVVPQDASVQVIKQQGAWFLVKTETNQGWMHGNTLKLQSYEIKPQVKQKTAPTVRLSSPVERISEPDNDASSDDYKTYSSREYITGPRGGCYYINSNGNKTYVDRSLCN